MRESKRSEIKYWIKSHWWRRKERLTDLSEGRVAGDSGCLRLRSATILIVFAGDLGRLQGGERGACFTRLRGQQTERRSWRGAEDRGIESSLSPS